MMELTITFDETTGQIGLSGPIDQRMMCYGMLEMAKEIIGARAQAPRPTSGIVVPNGHPLRLS